MGCLCLLRFVPSSVFLISVIMLFISVCLFFISSMSLVIVLTVLNASYIFSILFPSLWSNFTIIILNSLSGRLLNSSSFIWSCEFPPCSFISVVFLFLFIIFFFNMLCICCVDFLLKVTCACVLVGDQVGNYRTTGAYTHMLPHIQLQPKCSKEMSPGD